jgi:hypothetical protein
MLTLEGFDPVDTVIFVKQGRPKQIGDCGDTSLPPVDAALGFDLSAVP